MLSICPVCNGMDSWHYCCPECGGATQDNGKESDYWGPYSPYRPVDDLKLTNGHPDLALRECIHAAFCPGCSRNFIVPISETVR